MSKEKAKQPTTVVVKRPKVDRTARHKKNAEKKAQKKMKVPRGTARAKRRLKEDVRGKWLQQREATSAAA